MDLYLTSAEPGLTLQEMIEYDMKSGAFEDCVPEENPSKISKLSFDPSPFDLENFDDDIVSMASLDDSDFEFKPLEPLFENLLPTLDSENPTCTPVNNLAITSNSTNSSSNRSSNTTIVLNSPALSTDKIDSWMNLSSMSNYTLDAEHGIMVNPSVVLPSTMHGGTTNNISQNNFINVSAPSNLVNKINNIQTSTAHNGFTNGIFTFKKEYEPINKQSIISNRPNLSQGISQHQAISTQVILNSINTNTLSTSSPIQLNNSSLKHNVLTSSLTNNRNNPILTIPSNNLATSTTLNHSNLVPTTSSNVVNSAISRIGATPIYRTTSNTNQIHRAKTIPKYKRDRTPEERVFPKPAYSYSCLIALALKNSLTGSLPVSEIYSFMCEHFPYFRTAPNGWKNSVRHNLSLNKCFEKIEKPIVSGSNQRKGCLWALNPAKAHKMDEEVLKWSKKDLQGIKDAMTNPDILENLERGEMKFEVTSSSSSGTSSCSEDEEEEETESDNVSGTNNSELQPIKILNPLNSSIVLPGNGAAATRLIQTSNGGIRTIGQNNMMKSTQQTTTLIRRNSASPNIISSSSDQEYILPDSTMPEINIQSNGSIVDDFGNEIKIEGELGVLNPASSTNLILRKVNSPLRQSPVRSNFIYSPHQGGYNRLVLANTKMS